MARGQWAAHDAHGHRAQAAAICGAWQSEPRPCDEAGARSARCTDATDFCCYPDSLRAPDGATVLVHPSVLGSAVAPLAEVGEYAFLYDAHGLHAHIVLTPGAAADVGERLRIALIDAVASTGAVPPLVDVLPVPALQREPGGKLRLVRSA